MVYLSTLFFTRGFLLIPVALWLLPLGYGIYLLCDEIDMRESLVLQSNLSTAMKVPSQAPQSTFEFNPGAIATVMGLAAQDAAVRSIEPLTLRATFVSSTGVSRALLSGPDNERLYQVGDSLPGGSVLRRVEATQAVLWRKGREELLPLQSSVTQRVFTPKSSSRQSTPALIHFRPTADLLQGH